MLLETVVIKLNIEPPRRLRYEVFVSIFMLIQMPFIFVIFVGGHYLFLLVGLIAIPIFMCFERYTIDEEEVERRLEIVKELRAILASFHEGEIGPVTALSNLIGRESYFGVQTIADEYIKAYSHKLQMIGQMSVSEEYEILTGDATFIRNEVETIFSQALKSYDYYQDLFLEIEEKRKLYN